MIEYCQISISLVTGLMYTVTNSSSTMLTSTSQKAKYIYFDSPNSFGHLFLACQGLSTVQMIVDWIQSYCMYIIHVNFCFVREIQTEYKPRRRYTSLYHIRFISKKICSAAIGVVWRFVHKVSIIL